MRCPPRPNRELARSLALVCVVLVQDSLRLFACLLHGFLDGDLLVPRAVHVATERAPPFQPHAVNLPVLAAAFPKRGHVRFHLTRRTAAELEQPCIVPGVGVGRQAVA